MKSKIGAIIFFLLLFVFARPHQLFHRILSRQAVDQSDSRFPVHALSKVANLGFGPILARHFQAFEGSFFDAR